MAKYHAKICWNRNEARFTDNKYSRAHEWHFDGGITVPASSSPQVVPLPYSIESAVDPEEAFLASLSGCHMLWFLSIAAMRGYVVDQYKDDAEATMAKNNEGKLAITRVTLHPTVTYGTQTVSVEENSSMHQEAHKKCFIANSVHTKIIIEPEISRNVNLR